MPIEFLMGLALGATAVGVVASTCSTDDEEDSDDYGYDHDSDMSETEWNQRMRDAF
jgi:hypothetical protein